MNQLHWQYEIIARQPMENITSVTGLFFLKSGLWVEEGIFFYGKKFLI